MQSQEIANRKKQARSLIKSKTKQEERNPEEIFHILSQFLTRKEFNLDRKKMLESFSDFMKTVNKNEHSLVLDYLSRSSIVNYTPTYI